MKYLVFSDTHLTHKFDRKKCNVLKAAIHEADRVIINGDFWDGFSTTFDSFVNSEYKNELFPLLKKKKAIYIFGNHDKKKYTDGRVELFSDQQVSHFDLKSGKEEFHFEHGNRLVKLIDEQLHRRMPPIINNLYEAYEGFMVRRLGKRYLKAVNARFNKAAMQNFVHEHKKGNYLVIGHTHYAHHDENMRFVNTGIIKHGLAQYVYIEDGEITVVEKKY